MRTIILFWVGALLLGCAAKGGKDSASTRPAAPRIPAVVTRIGFASCAHQDRPQPIWEAIGRSKPQLFILLGDNIYADTLDMAVMKEKYQKFGKVEGFEKLRRKAPVLATWDDHDMG